MGEQPLYSLSEEEQALAVDVMNRMVKPAFEAVGKAILAACEAEGISATVSMTALASEALLLAAHMQVGCAGTPDSFVQMARGAVEHAFETHSASLKAQSH